MTAKLKKIFISSLFISSSFISLSIFSQELSESQINLLRENPELISEVSALGSISTLESTDIVEGEDKSVDDNIMIEEKFGRFGFDYIKSIPTSISSTSDLPVPNDYRISLGDKLRIILTGGKRASYDLKVALDGSILFPELGLVNIFNESLSDVRKKIKALVDISYVGTDVSVSLLELSAKKVNIIGAVKNPGTYIVNPFSTASTVLAYSGGFEDYASLRSIKILRDGKEINFDLYQLLIYGNRENDLNIQQGDTILVNSTTNFVEIKGSINRPFIYEYKNNESLEDLILHALGFTQKANRKNISITYLDSDLNLIKMKEVSFENKVDLSVIKNLLALEVFSIESSEVASVRVTGPLENQGYFNIPKSKMLSDLIPDLKFSNIVNPFIGVVQFEKFSRLFSLNDIDTQQIELKDNYEILFFSKEDDVLNNGRLFLNSKNLITDYMLRVFGAGDDTFQTNFLYFGKATALDVINFFGIDDENIISDKTTFVSPKDNLVITENFETLSFTARPQNNISFRRLDSEVITVQVLGETSITGTFILDSEATLADLYSLTGGLKTSADENIVVFERESVRERNLENVKKANRQINESLLRLNNEGNLIESSYVQGLYSDLDYVPGRISGDFSQKNIQANSNFYLQDGDSLFIPKKISTFSVIGEVYNNSTFVYSNDIDLVEAIKISGGYKKNALKRDVYVIRANGFIEKPRGLFRKNIKIYAGDTIVVPADPSLGSEFLRDILPLTSLLSNVAFTAAALDNLKQ